MKITIVESTIEGLRDEDHPVRVIAGHLTKDEIKKVMHDHGCAYPQSALIDDDGCWIGVFSNQEDDAIIDKDGYINTDVEGDLRLIFTHSEIESYLP